MNFDLAEINSSIAKFKRENNLDKNQILHLFFGKKEISDVKYWTYCGAPDDFNPISRLEEWFNVKILASEEESLFELSIPKVNT